MEQVAFAKTNPANETAIASVMEGEEANKDAEVICLGLNASATKGSYVRNKGRSQL
jgi:hypothetical protein